MSMKLLTPQRQRTKMGAWLHASVLNAVKSSRPSAATPSGARNASRREIGTDGGSTKRLMQANTSAQFAAARGTVERRFVGLVGAKPSPETRIRSGRAAELSALLATHTSAPALPQRERRTPTSPNTSLYGSRLTDLSQRAMWSITSTASKRTTGWRIWLECHVISTTRSLARRFGLMRLASVTSKQNWSGCASDRAYSVASAT